MTHLTPTTMQMETTIPLWPKQIIDKADQHNRYYSRSKTQRDQIARVFGIVLL